MPHDTLYNQAVDPLPLTVAYYPFPWILTDMWCMWGCIASFFSFFPPQSDMYRSNDVLLNGQRISNIFNTQDETWHNKYLRPIRNLWTLNKVLEYEPLVDETLNKFLAKIDANFVEGEGEGKTCPADEWMSYCRHMLPFCYLICQSRKAPWLINCIFSCMGCSCEYQFRSSLWVHRSWEGYR